MQTSRSKVNQFPRLLILSSAVVCRHLTLVRLRRKPGTSALRTRLSLISRFPGSPPKAGAPLAQNPQSLRHLPRTIFIISRPRESNPEPLLYESIALPIELGRHKRVTGIEPVSQPWEGRILPLNHTRLFSTSRTLFLRNDND